MTTATLATLKFVQAVKPSAVSTINPVERRRNALTARIEEQILLANSLLAGKPVEFTRTRSTKNAAGEVVKSTVPKKLAAWFWQSNGRYLVTVKYGASPLTFAKGTNAVETPALKGVVTVLTAFKTATAAGELDEAISAVTSKRKRKTTAPAK